MGGKTLTNPGSTGWGQARVIWSTNSDPSSPPQCQLGRRSGVASQSPPRTMCRADFEPVLLRQIGSFDSGGRASAAGGGTVVLTVPVRHVRRASHLAVRELLKVAAGRLLLDHNPSCSAIPHRASSITVVSASSANASHKGPTPAWASFGAPSTASLQLPMMCGPRR